VYIHLLGFILTVDARTQQLLEASPMPLLLRMATPNMLAFLIQASVSMAEVWFIGKLGTLPLAAIALVFPLLMLMQMMSGGAIGGAVTSSVARALGGANRNRGEQLVWHALIIAVLGAVAFLLLFALFGEEFLIFLGGEGAILESAMDYCWVLFPGAGLIWIMNISSSIYRGMGNMQFPASMMIVSAVIQVPLSGALILGWWGAPQLGITGAAVSTVIVSGLIAVVLLARLMAGKETLKLHPESFHLQTDLFRDIFRVALPASLSPIVTVLTIMSLTGIVARFGPAALAGYGIGSRLEFLLIPLVFGIGAAMTSIVGVNIGAGQWQRAERIGWLGGASAGLLAGLVGVTLALFPSIWVGLFTSEPMTEFAATRYLQIVGLCFVFQGMGLSLYFASQGAGNVTWPIIGTLLRFVVAVGGAYVAVNFYSAELEMVYYFAAAGMFVFGSITVASLALGAWRPKGEVNSDQ
jgi:putative MATE family efflux protein